MKDTHTETLELLTEMFNIMWAYNHIPKIDAQRLGRRAEELLKRAEERAEERNKRQPNLTVPPPER